MERVVIVTGAGGYIGSAIAMAFGKAGDKVVLSDINMSRLPQLAEMINKGPGEALTYKVDVRNYDEVKGMVEGTIKQWQRVDVMACVAGGGFIKVSGHENKALIEYSDEDWDLVVDTNLKGVFNCIKAVAEPMMAQKNGHIIIMGSGTGSKGDIKRSIYAAAKAGLLGLMKSAAREFGEHNIKINVVNPGRTLRPDQTPDRRTVQENVLKRVHTDPSQVAAFYVYLSRMEEVSGQIFNLDSRIIY